MAQQRLADYAHTDRVMTAKVLQTLERKGLVERLSHQQGGRAKQLQLIDAGARLLRQAHAVMKHNAQFFDPL